MAKAKHIAVLMGGWSPERDVSLVSGEECAEALHQLGYQISKIDANQQLAQELSEVKPDICFNALHGVGGEDGAVQGLLEVMKIPYTHSGVRASSLAMDKHLAKQIFAAAGLPIAPSMLVVPSELPKGEIAHPMPPPYVVKPINQGSSIGVEIVKSGSNKVPASLHPESKSGVMMVENYVAGRELTCAVMGDTVLDVLEITAASGFYDYHAKYTPNGSSYEMPAKIDAALAQEIQHCALTAHQVLGCRGVTRTDFRYDADGAGLAVLELNTQPGMTPSSLMRKIAAHRGINYPDLVQWIAEDASCQR